MGNMTSTNNQSTNQPSDQQTNQPANQPSDQQTNQPSNQPTNQPGNQSTNQPSDQSKDKQLWNFANQLVECSLCGEIFTQIFYKESSTQRNICEECYTDKRCEAHNNIIPCPRLACSGDCGSSIPKKIFNPTGEKTYTTQKAYFTRIQDGKNLIITGKYDIPPDSLIRISDNEKNGNKNVIIRTTSSKELQVIFRMEITEKYSDKCPWYSLIRGQQIVGGMMLMPWHTDSEKKKSVMKGQRYYDRDQLGKIDDHNAFYHPYTEAQCDMRLHGGNRLAFILQKASDVSYEIIIPEDADIECDLYSGNIHYSHTRQCKLIVKDPTQNYGIGCSHFLYTRLRTADVNCKIISI